MQSNTNEGNRLKYTEPAEPINILVIGDNPNMPEIIEGQPFQGTASMFTRSVLDELIAQKEKLLGEEFKPVIEYGYAYWGVTSKEVTQAQINEDAGILMDQVAKGKPQVIIALGGAANRAVAKTRAGELTRRGTWQWSAAYNAYVLLTHHPQFVRKNPNQFQTWVDDLSQAIRLLFREPGQRREIPTTKVYTLHKKSDVLEFLQFLRREPRVVASDIETMGFDFANDAFLCQGFTYKVGTSYVIPEELINDPDVEKELKLTCESPDITWVYHNGKFDNKFHRAQKGIRARTDVDTMLLHYCIDVRKGTHDLEQVAMEFVGAEPWEHEAHKYVKENFGDIPRPILYKYQGVDTDMTLRIYYALMERFEEIKETGRKIDIMFDLMMGASEAYMRIELNGHYTDMDQVERLYQEYEPRLEQTEKELKVLAEKAGWDNKAFADYRDEEKMREWLSTNEAERKPKKPGKTAVPKGFNPNSYQHIRYLLFSVWGLKPIMKKGKVTSDAGALEVYKERLTIVDAIRFIDAKLSYAKDKKMFSTYIVGINKIINKKTKRAHTTFKLHGTETGRLSSAEPNFHNIPRQSDIKNIFTSQPGYVLMQGDYSQAELRVLSVEGGDPWLQAVYREDRDLHDAISEQMYGPNFTKEQRVRAKAVNFGIAYGRTSYTLAAEFGLSAREGEQMIEDWYKPQPLTRAWIAERRTDPETGFMYETPTGRVRPFGLVTEKNKNNLQNEAVNFPIQSEASDCMMWSIIQIQPELDALNEKYGEEVARMVNTVHDSVITEVKADAQIIREVMEIEQRYLTSAAGILLHTDVPFKVDFEVGKSWGNLMDLVQDETGTYVAKDKKGNLIAISDIK